MAVEGAGEESFCVVYLEFFLLLIAAAIVWSCYVYSVDRCHCRYVYRCGGFETDEANSG